MPVKDDLAAFAAHAAPEIARDPRPRPVLRVGAMGHRRFGGREAHVAAGVDAALAAIRAAAAEALKEPATAARFSGELDLVVLSPLAEGADQMIAAAGRKLDYRLGAILPFAAGDYEKTFDLDDAEDSRKRFHALLQTAGLPEGYGVFVLDGDPSPRGRDAAFMACAAQITHWAEIVVAILSDDRPDSQTGVSVQQAIDTGMPVVIVDPHKDQFCFYFGGARVATGTEDAQLRAAVRTLFAAPDRIMAGMGMGGTMPSTLHSIAPNPSPATSIAPSISNIAGPIARAPWPPSGPAGVRA